MHSKTAVFKQLQFWLLCCPGLGPQSATFMPSHPPSATSGGYLRPLEGLYPKLEVRPWMPQKAFLGLGRLQPFCTAAVCTVLKRTVKNKL